MPTYREQALEQIRNTHGDVPDKDHRSAMVGKLTEDECRMVLNLLNGMKDCADCCGQGYDCDTGETCKTCNGDGKVPINPQ